MTEDLRVVAAAIKVGSTVYSVPSPGRHHDVIRKMHDEHGICEARVSSVQGFILSDGSFATRIIAKTVATNACQLLPRAMRLSELYSEDVW